MKKNAMFLILLFVALATFPILGQTPDSIYKKNHTDKRSIDNSGYHSGSATMADTAKGSWNSNDMMKDSTKMKKKKQKTSESGSSSETKTESGTSGSSSTVYPNSTGNSGTKTNNSNSTGTTPPPASSGSSSSTETK